MIERVAAGRAEVRIRDRGRIKEIEVRDRREKLPRLSFRAVEDDNLLWFDGQKAAYLYLVPDAAVMFVVSSADGLRVVPIALSKATNEDFWNFLSQAKQGEAVEFVYKQARVFKSVEEAVREFVNLWEGKGGKGAL
jgi:hypothetical protein